jgi:GT2 family glycosyltransferase
MGPDIISTVDNSHQNPRDESLDTPENVEKLINHYKKLLILNYLFIDHYLVSIKKYFVPSSKLPALKTNFSVMHNKELLNIKLHGSALIFSKEYIQKYDGLFPKTFMYSEESILYFIAKRDGLTTLYSPSVTIFHKEDSATDSVYKNKLLKRRFYLKNFVKSGKELIKIMRDEEKWPN